MELQNYHKKKKNAERNGNYTVVAEMCNKIANFHSNAGNYEEAFQAFSEMKTVLNRMSDGTQKMEEGRAYRMMGEMRMLLGEFEEALEHENRYLSIAISENDKVEQQRAYATIGRIYLIMGQSEESQKSLAMAEKMFLKALLLCKTISGTLGKFEAAEMEGRIYLNLGVVKEFEGNFVESEKYLVKAINIAKKNDLHELLHQCYMSLGNLHSNHTKDLTKSLHMYNLALNVAEKLKDRNIIETETLIAKAEVFLKFGDHQSARQPLVQAYKIKSTQFQDSVENLLKAVIVLEQTEEKILKLNTENYAENKFLNERMGDAWCKLKNYGKATQYYEKMLECAEKNGESGRALIPIYVSLYQTYKDNEQYGLALNFLWREHELVQNDPMELCETLLTIAEVQEEAKYSFFDVNEIYRKAFDANKCKKVLKRWKSFAQKNGMLHEEQQIVQLAVANDILLEDDTQESEFIEDTPINAVFDEINLEQLFPPEEPQRRRKRTSFTMRKNEKGESQLHQACIAGNLNLVRKLLEQGHPTMIRDNAGWLPLHEAANNGYKEIVIELLKFQNNKDEINDRGGTECNGITPLYDACSNGQLEIAELLLERGANPLAKTDTGETVLEGLDSWRKKVHLDSAELVLFQNLRSKIESYHKKVNVSTSSSSGSSTPSFRNKRQKNEFIRMRSDSSIDLDQNNRKTPSNTKSPIRGAKEYKNVMERLRKPHSSTTSSPLTSSSNINIRKPALIDSTDYVDDWLEEDIIPAKKRKLEISYSSPKRNFDPPKSSTSTQKTPIRRINSSETSRPSTPIIINESPRKVPLPTPTSTSRDLQNDFIMETQQDASSAYDVFDQFVIEDDDEMPLWNQDVVTENASILDKTPISVSVNSNSTHVPYESPSTSYRDGNNLTSVAVRIENELIVVPVKSDLIDNLTIGWLSKEASDRYASLFTRKPEIQLILDGAIVVNSDPLVFALNATEITARILSWKEISLTDQYTAACTELHQEPIENISNLLEEGHIDCNFQFNNQNLTMTEFKPICNTLKSKHPITLDLSNNFLNDEAVKYLMNAENILKNMRYLNLSGNLLTSSCVIHLKRELPALQELKLNFNALGDAALSNLCFSTLTHLYLSNCRLRNVEALPLEGITCLDLSFNNISSSIFSLRRKITEIQDLNLSFVPNVDWNEFFTGTLGQLKNLKLNGNNIQDAHCYQIVEVCPNLELLDLSFNPDLTKVALEKLLKSNIKQLFLEGCSKILNNFEESGNLRFKMPDLLHVSVNEGQIESQTNLIKKLWKEQHNEKGVVKMSSNLLVKAYLLSD